MPLGLGFFIGILASIMGVGGGFLMIPAMIYLIGMPTTVVIGTSLFQISFVTAVTTFLHAVNNYTVDVVLALSLIVGGVVGAQFGSSAGAYLRGEQLRILLALIVLAVCIKLGHDLVVMPDDLYSIGAVGLLMPVRARLARLIVVLGLATLPGGAAPQAQNLVADLSHHLIAITTAFVGTQVVAFGVARQTTSSSRSRAPGRIWSCGANRASPASG